MEERNFFSVDYNEINSLKNYLINMEERNFFSKYYFFNIKNRIGRAYKKFCTKTIFKFE